MCYPLVNVYIAMENHHAINGKIHYFYGHFQLQTVSSPEAIVDDVPPPWIVSGVSRSLSVHEQ